MGRESKLDSVASKVVVDFVPKHLKAAFSFFFTAFAYDIGSKKTALGTKTVFYPGIMWLSASIGKKIPF